ncbi:MoxR family ATPase (plasmid) [Streptosporangium sp. NBC_01495]|uniref:MoxR family ATPase n=1 Tax=Streptosporangium sp. NBC_01495 TaxID=2903899 RepID=UPI002E2F0059|nr:MoxR family ATPase [Streptosporangium sp. NBC_01495]
MTTSMPGNLADALFGYDDDSFRPTPNMPPPGARRPRQPFPATPRRSPTALKAVGQRKRPNGELYKPRQVDNHEDLALLEAARKNGEHVVLVGPPGTGKTAVIEAAFAPPHGPGFETIIGTADTTEMDLVGTFIQDPSTSAFVWVPGPLQRSVERGVPLLVDEIALIDSRVLSVLYALMDGRGVLHIPANPKLAPIPVATGWMVAAAYNPDVPGANVSDALTDRFTHHIEVGTDWNLAIELGVPADIVKIAKNLDQRRIKGEISSSPQLRALLAFRDLSARYGERYAAANLAARAPRHDRDTIVEALQTRFHDIAAARLGGRYGG